MFDSNVSIPGDLLWASYSSKKVPCSIVPWPYMYNYRYSDRIRNRCGFLYQQGAHEVAGWFYSCNFGLSILLHVHAECVAVAKVIVIQLTESTRHDCACVCNFVATLA